MTLMILHNLTTSGWVLFALTSALTLAFLARFPMRAWADAGVHAFTLGILLVWMLWLVTP